MLVTRINLVLQKIKAQHAKALADHDISPRQVYVMMAIADTKEAPSQTDLVETTGIDRSTLADIVRRLAKRGYIARKRRKDDARAYQVYLTNEGRTMLKLTTKIMQKVEKSNDMPGIEHLSAAVERCLAPAQLAAAE